jgi:hypothetical protein
VGLGARDGKGIAFPLKCDASLTRIRIRGIAGLHTKSISGVGGSGVRGLVVQWWPEIWGRDGQVGGKRNLQDYRTLHSTEVQYSTYRLQYSMSVSVLSEMALDWRPIPAPTHPRTSPSQPSSQLDGAEERERSTKAKPLLGLTYETSGDGLDGYQGCEMGGGKRGSFLHCAFYTPPLIIISSSRSLSRLTKEGLSLGSCVRRPRPSLSLVVLDPPALSARSLLALRGCPGENCKQ